MLDAPAACDFLSPIYAHVTSKGTESVPLCLLPYGCRGAADAAESCQASRTAIDEHYCELVSDSTVGTTSNPFVSGLS